MIDSKIIEEALKEPKIERKVEINKTAKEKLFEHLLYEMYPQSCGYEQPKTKYTRLRDLISILQDALWKIEDYNRKIEENPEDKDVYESVKTGYDNVVNSVIDRIKEVWNSADEQPVENNQEQSPDQESGDVDWSQVTLQLQPESIIISPQNKEYYVEEVKSGKAKLKEVNSGAIFQIDVKDAKKWKRK